MNFKSYAILTLSSNVQIIFSAVQYENASQHPDIVTEVADSLMTLGHYASALKYYRMLEGDDNKNKVKK